MKQVLSALHVSQKEKISATPFQAYSEKWKTVLSLSSVEIQALSSHEAPLMALSADSLRVGGT